MNKQLFCEKLSHRNVKVQDMQQCLNVTGLEVVLVYYDGFIESVP